MKSPRLEKLFQKKGKILSVYCTAGFPALHDSVPVCEALQAAGVDLIELGMPFSDPVADGPTIQKSSEQALRNGMSLKVLFQDLKALRKNVQLPVLLMGYLNPILQFGVEKFCAEASQVGIDGVILPDLPLEEYRHSYKELFEKYNLAHVCLLTSRSTEERVRLIDAHSDAFLYAVSSEATTGSALRFDAERKKYLERLKSYHLRNPVLVGFGIADQESFESACEFTRGAIIGSAFIRALQDCKGNVDQAVMQLVSRICPQRKVA